MKRSGFFVEQGCLPALADGASILSGPRAPSGAAETQTVAEYLDGGATIAQALGWTTDHFDPEVRLPLDILTDGEWIWPAFAAHYCRRHGILPAPELTAIALTAQGRCRPPDGPELERIAAAFFASQQTEQAEAVFQEAGR